MENPKAADLSEVFRRTSDESPSSAGLTRRQFGVAAAWAAPIVAVAASTPLASASIENPLTNIEVTSETSLSGSTVVGAAISGRAGGSFYIENHGPGWNATPVRARYDLSGQLAAHQILYNGIEIVVNQIITATDGTTWIVTEYGATPGGKYASLYITSPLVVPADGTVTAATPVLTFATTSTAVPTSGFPIQWQLELGARANTDPSYSISDITGKSIPGV